MPHAARTRTAGRVTADGRGAPAVRLAPYALVRTTVLAHPAQTPPAADFRAVLAGLAALDAETLALLPQLCDALHASHGDHPLRFHHDVVLPLRRALHNGREPRPGLLDRLGDLPQRVPHLAAWLALRQRRQDLLARLAGTAADALAAERTALAGLCREPALGAAVALTSPELLRAVDRAAGTDTVDPGTHRARELRKARKEEPGVLRYALRASTKTSPLSWFTAVGWGPLPDEDDMTADATASPLPPRCDGWLPAEPPVAVIEPNRTLVGALCEALLSDPRRRRGLPHRITATPYTDDGLVTFARSKALAAGRFLATAEDEATVARSRPLDLVCALAAAPADLDSLTDGLAAALRNTGDGAHAAASSYLQQLVDAGLLVPSAPVDPQSADPLDALAQWLRDADDGQLADRLTELARATDRFGGTAARHRPALLTALSERWHAVLEAAGGALPAAVPAGPPDSRPADTPAAPLPVLTEDVVIRRPLRLDGSLGTAERAALGELTAVAELFDLGHLLRRIIRDRFVDRYGPGGRCRHPWKFAPEYAKAWRDVDRVAALVRESRDGDGPADGLPSGCAELARLRSELLAVTEDQLATTAAADAYADVVLPTDTVRGLAERLPHWMLHRPLSYAWFLQRDPADGLLCVNHVYGGWGRFTSRFLHALDPAAAGEVARQIRGGLGTGARAAQVRPVGGFNANLHPLLVPDEIGPDRRWASIGESDVELAHDEATDQVRIRLRDTGEWLDVLYAGFLAPIMLPERAGPFLADHPAGVTGFGPLVPRRVTSAPGIPGGPLVRTPRLRYRNLVLRRRRWELAGATVEALRAELAVDQDVPAATVARWRALLDLPDQLFLHPAPPLQLQRTAEDFLLHLRLPKPQFVDLGNALHLRCLGRWLARYPDGAVLEEALPAPGGRALPSHAVELVVETYREGRRP